MTEFNSQAVSRRDLARARLERARAALRDCQLCAHRCGVDRVTGGRGRCHAGPAARVFSAQIEVSDEVELIPVYAIAFSGCDLRCDFCITGRESWDPRAGRAASMEEVAAAAETALKSGARSIMILGGEPTIHLPAVLELVSHWPDEARLVWKTNAHGTPEARALLDGLFDVWVADYKFGNDACAARLAGVNYYTRVVQENLLWAAEHAGLIVRHLLMPGHEKCCWEPVARWLAEHLPHVKVNLRAGFWAGWRSGRHTELNTRTSPALRERAVAVGRELELELVS